MTKTPDEIKKGLECCHVGQACECTDCPYSDEGEETMNCDFLLGEDALALIQQLEAQNAEKDARIQQLEAERDAAVENIRGDCVYCLHLCEDMVAPSCFDCANKGFYRWEWRGVQKEE